MPESTSQDERSREGRLIAAAVALALGTFVADTFLPLGVAGGAPYTVLVLLGLWSRRRAFVPALAGAATVLTIIGAVLSPPGNFLWMGVVNRILTLLAIWATTILLLRYERTRRELMQSRRDARAYLENAEVAFVVLDREGQVVLLNRKGGEILECDPREAIGENWFEKFTPSPVADEMSRVFRRLMADEIGAAEYYENPVRTATGRERIMAWHNTVLRDDKGTITGTLSSGEDVTERRKAEETARRRHALARLGQMAAVVAHEVKNPIAGVTGAIQIIAKRLPEGCDEREIVQTILERLDGLNRMSQDLLDFARPREPELRRVDLRKLVEKSAAFLAQDPNLGGVQVEIDAVDRSVAVDPELLETVLRNLLLNAAQAMNGEGTIRVSVTFRDRQVLISVSDEGPGIPTDQRERAFEPFFTTKHRGTGLGLPVAKQVVEAHGGEISIECPPGGGTSVVICLPDRSRTKGRRPA